MPPLHPLDQFEAAWSAGSVPEWQRFVELLKQAGEESSLSELCQIDMEHRWRSSDPAVRKFVTHDYLGAHGLSLHRSDAIELICWEYHVRNRWGDFPGSRSVCAEWSQYLPDLESALRQISDELSRPLVSLTGIAPTALVFPLDGVLDVGRQRSEEPSPTALVETHNGLRLIVAALTDSSISRNQLIIRQDSATSILLANTSRNRAIAVAGIRAVDAGESASFQIPVRIHLGGARFLCVSAAVQ